MSERFPRYAENLVKTLCSQYGVSCHEVEEDLTGWDLQVELPVGDQKGPPDTHAGFWQTYIQVKSTKSKTAKCRIKLSNMLHAAQSVNPWFIILVQRDPTEKIDKIYIKHIWQTLIELTLEKVRKAYEQDRHLHKVEMNIRFREDERYDENPISKIHEKIKDIGHMYYEKKVHIYNTIGYEEGGMQGSITVKTNNKEEFIENFLGLGGGITVESFTAYRKRFGIISKNPEVQLDSGTLKIIPYPVTRAEVRLVGRRSGESISQEAVVYSTPFPNVPASEQHIRFSTSFLEIVHVPDGTGRIKANWDAYAENGILDLSQFCKFNKILFAEGVDAEVWYENRKLLGAHVSFRDNFYELDWVSLDNILSLFLSCCSEKYYDYIKISLADVLEDVQKSIIFSTVASSKTVMLEFENMKQSEEDICNFDNVVWALYYTYVKIKRYVFCKIIKREIISNILLGNSRKIEMGHPVTMRSYVLSAEEVNALETLKIDYQRAVESEEATGADVLDIKDISYSFSNE